jgi:ABC-type multidrug transport system ATPase subunit
MRLKSLHIKDYGILKDFDIDFQNNLSVLIGENGSGKSSIIECIAYIFGHLHKYFVLGDKTAEFIDGYQIEYEINANNVFIESKYVASKTNTFQPTIKISGNELSMSQIRDRYGNFKMFLPEKVILSYSGVTEHLKELNKHFEDKFIRKIIGDNSYSLLPLNLPDVNPFMYVKKEYVSFILLALFVLNTEEAQEIFKTIGIDINGCTTTITLKKPSWATTGKEKANNSLWGMSGKIALDFLDGLALVGIPKENRDEKTNEIKSFDFEFYGSLMIQDLFKSYFKLSSDQVVSFLDTLLCDDLLKSVNITWGDDLSVDRLSEGEKQLILSVGLGLVLNKKNLLFLYDEPDVSLHPKWQQYFISNMEKGLDSESMAVITTHSPILVSNLQKSYIHIINKGKKLSIESLYSYGRDINSVLEDYFGIEERNEKGKKLIDDFYKAMTDKKYNEAETILDEIEKSFGPDDIATIKANSIFDDLAE